jgi:hypothetical protein
MFNCIVLEVVTDLYVFKVHAIGGGWYGINVRIDIYNWQLQW